VFSRKFIIRFLALIGIYVAAASYIFQNEEKFFFDHEKIEASTSYSFKVPFKEMSIPVNKEVELHAILFTHSDPAGLVLLFPSGEYQPLQYDPRDFFLYRMGYNLLIPDYRGTAKSNAQYGCEEEIYKDAHQWYLMSRRLADSNKLIVYGQDFGAGQAAWIGGEQHLDLVILENPFYSWDKLMLKKYFWWLPHSYFTHFHIPLWKFLRKSTNKTILVHAIDNQFVKYENSQRLLEFIKPGDKLITTEGKQLNQNSRDFQNELEKYLN